MGLEKGEQQFVTYDDWHGQRGEDLCERCHHPRRSHRSLIGGRLPLCRICVEEGLPQVDHEFLLGADKGPIAVLRRKKNER